MHAYLFWYRRSAEERTTYIKVIALNENQAIRFWFRYLKYMVGYCIDYAIDAIDVRNEEDFIKPHKVGDILGQDATI